MRSQKDLYRFVIEKLGDDRDYWKEVAEAAGVSPHTVIKIACGQIKEPGVFKIQKLADYFSRQQA